MRSLPTLQPAAAPSDVRAGTAPAALSRRGFVSAATWSVVGAALASGCGDADGSGGPAAPPSGGGITLNGGVLTIALGAEPALAARDGFLVVQQARTIVINAGGDVYRAFTSVCTHEQCDVNGYSGGRIRCPCHGSQYDARGRVVVGPATLPLAEYPTTFDPATRTITVARG